jgi:hypothetical protein
MGYRETFMLVYIMFTVMGCSPAGNAMVELVCKESGLQRITSIMLTS